MTRADIKTWLTYWNNGSMVAVDAIRALDQVHQARKFCQCMRVGVFHPDLVSDGQIWDALREMRAEA